MIGSFLDSFSEQEDILSELPKEIIDILSRSLPENFTYIRTDEGKYVVAPKPEKFSEGIMLSTQFDLDEIKDSELLSKLEIIPRDKWTDYFYRIQKKVPVKNAKVGDNNKMIPLEELSREPLADGDVKVIDCFVQATGFPKPFKMRFESLEGDKVEILIQQQPYDSITEIKFSNIDFPALALELYYYSPLVENTNEKSHTNADNRVVMACSVTPSNASSVKEAITALHIFKGIYNGTVKANGVNMVETGEKLSFNKEQIDDALDFWKNVLKLESIFNVSFDPKAECPEEDIRFFIELKTCFIDKKAIVWHHPFDHFTAKGFKPVKEGITIEDCIGNESLYFEFLEGPIHASFMGADFNIYSHTEMKDFVITNIDKKGSDEETEIYISDVRDKQWVLSRMYLTETEAGSCSLEVSKQKQGE